MRVLIVYAHPLETSYLSAVHACVVETLRKRRCEVDDLDLYKERFDPVLSREQMRSYVDVRKNALEVGAYVERLRAADALVLVFPVWFDGLPAIMQGYFQRVFLPGVATVIDENELFTQISGTSNALRRSAPTVRTAPRSRRSTTLRAVSSATTSAL